ncbi:MAG: zinc ribbon domain-containing protein [Clostridia bacterium]|nr:zinc ribbon domain-containing protein [Clostridia bacterium]
MKSIKPGRGPSMMSAIVGIFVAIFGVVWTIAAVSMGAGIFGLFGLVFVAIAIVNVVYNFKNATGKNRYSSFDITEEGEETDPWNERFGEKREQTYTFQSETSDSKYCPYCGAKAQGDFEYCNQCGKRLP